MGEFIAHLRVTETGEVIYQTVKEHSEGCAKYASESILRTLSRTAYLAGLFHDMGKCTEEFSEYIRSSENETGNRKRVIHSFTGVKYVLSKWHASADDDTKLTSELIAYAIGAHHGLFDVFDQDGMDGFLRRLSFNEEKYSEGKDNFFKCVITEDVVEKIFTEAVSEVKDFIHGVKVNERENENIAFAIGLISRMVLSAVIDGDRKDTSYFMKGDGNSLTSHSNEVDWDRELTFLEDKIRKLPCRNEIDEKRHAFSDMVAAFKGSNGIYRMNIPTGGGKTLSSLRLALKLASQGKRRIFFIIPLLSILEQNAAVIKSHVRDSSIVLEHHSNLVQDDKKEKDDNDVETDEEFDEKHLFEESWTAPIVITTLFQFLQTSFGSRTSEIRRFAAISNSVLVFDEVQTVPVKMLSLFNMVLNFLAYSCNCTVILSSATLPALEYVEGSAQGIKYAPDPDIIRYDENLWNVFKRTEIINKYNPYGWTMKDISSIAIQEAESGKSVLLVCNTRKEAKGFFKEISSWDGKLFHLSTDMCMAHRRKVLEEIRNSLDDEEPVICVSTQLIEAGVDISFETVIRITAGLDNVIQTAGRCNRNGECEGRGKVIVVNLKNENLKGLNDIARAQNAFLAVADEYDDKSLDSLDAIETYFYKLYSGLNANATKYPSQKTTLYELLASNRIWSALRNNSEKYCLSQAFKSACSEFKVFEDDTVEILVPYGEGANLIEKLCSLSEWEFGEKERLFRKAQAYSVSIFKPLANELCTTRKLSEIKSMSIFYIASAYYSDKIGLDVSEKPLGFLEV